MQDGDDIPFDGYDTPFDESEGSVADLDARLDPVAAAWDGTNATLDRLEAAMHAGFDRIEATLHGTDARLKKVATTRQVLVGGTLLTLEITVLMLIGLCWR
jgi:hypothetical protein